jgi:hypothetical protein
MSNDSIEAGLVALVNKLEIELQFGPKYGVTFNFPDLLKWENLHMHASQPPVYN